MTEQRQLIKTIAPAPSIAPGSPFRVSLADLFTRSVLIESANTNTGNIFVGFSLTDMISGRYHMLKNPGDFFSLTSSEWGNLNAEFNLKEIWLDGSAAADKVIISYIEITEKMV